MQKNFFKRLYDKYGDQFEFSGNYHTIKDTKVNIKCNDCGYEYQRMATTLLSSDHKCPRCRKNEKIKNKE